MLSASSAVVRYISVRACRLVGPFRILWLRLTRTFATRSVSSGKLALEDRIGVTMLGKVGLSVWSEVLFIRSILKFARGRRSFSACG